MYRQSFLLWCCALLLLVSSSESQENSMIDNLNDNSTMQYELDTDSVRNQSDNTELMWYDSDKNSTADDEQVWHEFSMNSTKDYEDEEDEEDDQMLTEFCENCTMYESKNNSTSYEFHEYYNGIEITTVTYEMCNKNVCLNLCCPLGHRLIEEDCVLDEGNYSFPEVNGSRLNEVFQLIMYDPCDNESTHFSLNNYPDMEYKFIANGSVAKPQGFSGYIQPTKYCLAVTNRNQYDVSICVKKAVLEFRWVRIGFMVSLPFLLITFIVYSILPDLQNMHGYMLRAHIASLFATYTILTIFYHIALDQMGYTVCLILSFIFTISFLASFLWLTATCFDIWLTFGGFRVVPKLMKQKEDKKKFAIYSACVWGSILIWIIISAIMDFVPGLPAYLIKPKLCIYRSWLGSSEALSVYFYIPMVTSVACNICLFISTTVRIICQKRNIANQLDKSESVRHGENQQRFCMYLKLFIVMGISWFMEILAWAMQDIQIPDVLLHINYAINSLQGVIIFSIFVCRKKIMQQIIERFGWQNHCQYCMMSTSDSQSNATTSSCVTPEVTPMREINPKVYSNCPSKNLSDKSNC